MRPSAWHRQRKISPAPHEQRVYYSGGACLTRALGRTAREFTSSTWVRGTIPGCTAIQSNLMPITAKPWSWVHRHYYERYSRPGRQRSAALTNGCISGSCGSGGHNQFGAIISAAHLPAPRRASDFQDVTYRGDSGGTGDGADGISFFLLNSQLTSTSGVTTANTLTSASTRQSRVYLFQREGNYGYAVQSAPTLARNRRVR